MDEGTSITNQDYYNRDIKDLYNLECSNTTLFHNKIIKDYKFSKSYLLLPAAVWLGFYTQEMSECHK